MKTRYGFVSNSSSASFIIDKRKVSDKQLKQIRNHIRFSYKNFPYHKFYNRPEDAWSISEQGGWMHLYTTMDNFNMRKFLELIGVPEDAFSIEDN